MEHFHVSARIIILLICFGLSSVFAYIQWTKDIDLLGALGWAIIAIWLIIIIV